MERLNRNIRAPQSPLEQAPEVFNPVRVNVATHILLHVIHGLVNEEVSRIHTLIADVLIGVDVRSPAHMLNDFVLQSLALRIRYNHRPNLASVARPHAHDNSFLIAILISNPPLGVHVPGLAAYIRLVYLYLILWRAADLATLLRLHNLANPLEHKPSRLLGNADATGHLIGANTVLAVRQHPKCRHPFVEADRRIFEDRADLERELLLARIAIPNLPGLDERVLIATAPGASDNPIRPTQIEGVLEGAVSVREVNNRLLQCLWAFHELKVRPKDLCVNYIITYVSL
jgi:hypothetical protein